MTKFFALLMFAVFPVDALAQAQLGTPFVSAPKEDAVKGLPGNQLDPLGLWNQSDVTVLDSANDLAVSPAPSIHALALPTPEGTVVVSQLWDASCTNYECPTKVVRIPAGGGKAVVLLGPMMLHQITPDEPGMTTKGLNDEPSFFLSKDNKLLVVVTDQHGTQTFDLGG